MVNGRLLLNHACVMEVGLVSLDGLAPVMAQWDPTVRWNGWLCPRFDPHAVVTVLDSINAIDGGDSFCSYDWTDEGFLLLVEHEDSEGGVELIGPDADGLYPLGHMAWIWSRHTAS